jgi:hypothetical protein
MWKEEGGKGYIFFNCGEAREGKGVIFLQIHYGTGGRVHRGFRVQVDFFNFFLLLRGRGVEVNVFFAFI